MGSSFNSWLERLADKMARLHCVHCGDLASMPGPRGPACVFCAQELANGTLPPPAVITGKRPPPRKGNAKEADEARRNNEED